MSQPSTNFIPHSLFEDIVAILMASIMLSLGISFFKEAGMLSGGVTGIALLLNHFLHVPFSWVFFLLNMPFFFVALRFHSKTLAVKSLLCATLVSCFTLAVPHLFQIKSIQPYFGAVAGGFLFGMGLLALIRHQSSLGGFTILALIIQERFNVSAGKVQLSIDVFILTSSFILTDVKTLILSLLGVFTLNLVISLFHKKGRYRGLG